LQGIIDTGMEAFGHGMTHTEIIDHVSPASRIYVAVSGYHESIDEITEPSQILGFGLVEGKSDEAYLSGAAVRPSAQKKGIYSDLLNERVSEILAEGIGRISTRTQNPIVFQLTESAIKGRIQDYDTDFTLIEGVYGRQLNSSRPLSGDRTIDERFSGLDYEKGDAYYITFRVRI
jgi:GNAT superfamily N-acetyltransferase